MCYYLQKVSKLIDIFFQFWDLYFWGNRIFVVLIVFDYYIDQYKVVMIFSYEIDSFFEVYIFLIQNLVGREMERKLGNKCD